MLCQERAHIELVTRQMERVHEPVKWNASKAETFRLALINLLPPYFINLPLGPSENLNILDQFLAIPIDLSQTGKVDFWEAPKLNKPFTFLAKFLESEISEGHCHTPKPHIPHWPT